MFFQVFSKAQKNVRNGENNYENLGDLNFPHFAKKYMKLQLKKRIK